MSFSCPAELDRRRRQGNLLQYEHGRIPAEFNNVACAQGCELQSYDIPLGIGSLLLQAGIGQPICQRLQAAESTEL